MGHDPISERPLLEIRPSPENDDIYGVINRDDPEIIAMAESIREFGVREPLVISLDGFILSGHRRYTAAKRLGLLTVPCRVDPIRREDDIDQFVLLLREFNRQRDKSLAVKLREELINANPEESHRALSEYRTQQSGVDADAFEIVGRKQRAKISKAKQPMLDAIFKVINDGRKFWPLSDRAIHYGLLNDPPLKHASKSNSVYDNSGKSYKALVELLTRARLAGHIDWRAIHDPTRPVTTWKVYANPRRFIREQVDHLLKGYYRNLMQSQPHHIEIVAEKNTIKPILKPVAGDFTIPLTSGRGYCSLPPRYAMAKRFQRSGKAKLILLMVSDFDPDGEEIAQSFARSKRDDFGIEEIHPIKVALTAQQVQEYELPPVMTAKATSTNYDRFVDQYGDSVFELEALDPDDLQTILTTAIELVIDIDAYNHEVAEEEKDAAFLDGVRNTVHVALQQMNWESDE
ncbi:ParB/RepB/Spo0J family partition protein [Symmachiella macrocystis]|uniref:ParB/RepB/Spo0J family partition protein n=1 Tax=Symmachiella macrocystis TaxID=2527985 RepID=UPI0018D308DE|nr:ParB N-terminal domain-containing protein [Symmachiella macrocystis]